MSITNAPDELDVMIVGAGFAGLYQLNNLRKLGFKVRAVEAAPGLGGVWYWNCYPGARVDTWGPMYQYSDESLWKDWNFTELYPDWAAVRKYFEYVDAKLDLSRDITFGTAVTGARFDENSRCWTVTTKNDETGEERQTCAHTVLLCMGFGSKPLMPDIPGLGTFEGVMSHTARWPQDGHDLVGKRIGVIGTGASGVQVIQETAPIAEHLTVFQRTPMLALPMRQRSVSAEESAREKVTYAERMVNRTTSFGGFDFDFLDRGAMDDSQEARQTLYEGLWKIGGFAGWVGTYNDIFLNEESNRTFYDFWRDKTRRRIKNEELWETLAPTEPPHPFGVKRPSLEQRYYEVYDRDNVDLIDISANPIDHVSPKGVVTADGVEHELDVLILATGFDAVTGGMTAIDIRGVDGQSFGESFENGAHTALGVATSGFPNMLFVYGPQSPAGFCNGPTCAEAQGDWIVNFITDMRRENVTRFEATPEAEKRWQDEIDLILGVTLFGRAASWYMGRNVPGKPVQMLMYPGGLPAYLHAVNESRAQEYPEFVRA